MDNKLSIKIKHLSVGTYEIEIGPDQTVGQLKELISKKSGVVVDEIKLIFRGKIMKDDTDSMEDQRIKSGNTLHMVKNKSKKPSTTTTSSSKHLYSISLSNPTNLALLRPPGFKF